jgi:hypothetical protein
MPSVLPFINKNIYKKKTIVQGVKVIIKYQFYAGLFPSQALNIKNFKIFKNHRLI